MRLLVVGEELPEFIDYPGLRGLPPFGWRSFLREAGFFTDELRYGIKVVEMLPLVASYVFDNAAPGRISLVLRGRFDPDSDNERFRVVFQGHPYRRRCGLAQVNGNGFGYLPDSK